MTEDGVEILEHLFKISTKISTLDVAILCELGNDEPNNKKIAPLLFLLLHQRGIDFLKQRIAQDPSLAGKIFEEMTRQQANNSSIFLTLSQSESGILSCQKLLSSFNEIKSLFKSNFESLPFSEEIDANFKKYTKNVLVSNKDATQSPLVQLGFYATKEPVHEDKESDLALDSLFEQEHKYH